MRERVIHGVWVHCIQLRVPHTVLFGEQEGDKLQKQKWKVITQWRGVIREDKLLCSQRKRPVLLLSSIYSF